MAVYAWGSDRLDIALIDRLSFSSLNIVMNTVFVQFLRLYFRSNLRGSTWLTDVLSHRFSRFQAIPIQTSKGTVVADLRRSFYRNLLVDNEGVTDEEFVMRKFIRPGNVAFDVGVYVGLYTALMSGLVGTDGEVHSFEPSPAVLPSLRLTAGLLGNVVLHEHGLSESEGEATFYVPSDDASMASLADWTGGRGGSVEAITCKMFSLDNLLAENRISAPDFVKCDVEGAEIKVLRGGAGLFNRKAAPVIFFEVNPDATTAFGYEPDCCFRFLESLEMPNYRFFQVADNDLTAVGSFADLVLNVYGYTNAVAIPEARMQ